MTINMLYWLCTSQTAIKYKKWDGYSAGVRKKGCRWQCRENLCYRWKYFPDRRFLLIPELCPWAWCFYQRPSTSSGPSPGTALMSPSNAGAGRAARLGTHLGTCPGPGNHIPGNHIPGGAAKGPQLEQLHLTDLRAGQGPCCTGEHQGSKPG